MDAPTDEQLLQEYIAGHVASFELLVRRHSHELFKFVVRFTSDSVAAEDVVQETFLQVHTAAARFDLNRRFKPWLFTIAANKARDYLRKRKRRHELSFEANVANQDDSSQRYLDLLSDDSPESDEGLLLEEKRASIKATVDAMPDKLREILILAYFHRLAYKEIGEVIDIPVGTVKSRLHSAVASFRGLYDDQVKKRSKHEP